MSLSAAPYFWAPRKYWFKNSRKFISLWRVVQDLKAKLYLVNYAKKGTENEDEVLLIEVLTLNESGIQSENVTKMNRMRNPNPGKTFKSSISALKSIYYVIIGLAITEALKRTFTEGGQFLEMQIFHLNRLLLVLAFMFTICRFVHGASIHLGEFSEKKHKPIVDFFGFILQGSLFYIMAIALNKPLWFLIFFFCMLFLDTVWILILRTCKFIITTQTENQWLHSNAIMMSLFVVLFLINQFIDKTFSSIFTVSYIFLAASVATCFDYKRNWSFYFPKTYNHGK